MLGDSAMPRSYPPAALGPEESLWRWRPRWAAACGLLLPQGSASTTRAPEHAARTSRRRPGAAERLPAPHEQRGAKGLLDGSRSGAARPTWRAYVEMTPWSSAARRRHAPARPSTLPCAFELLILPQSDALARAWRAYARWPLRHSALFTLDPSAPCAFCRCHRSRNLAPAPRGHLDPRATLTPSAARRRASSAC